jgi:Holliday junction resolvasome RuvABC endonuclease subunit
MPQASSNVAAIIGMDPGSFSLGVAVLHFNIETLQIVSVEAWTLNGVKLAREYPWVVELHGDLEGRIHGMRERLFRTLMYFQPLLVASEAPFISKKFPQAGLVLTRVVSAVRHAVMQFDVWKTVDFIDPPTVKNAVGVKGNKGGKEGKDEMAKAVAKLVENGDIVYTGLTPLAELDEHSIDAIAVAYGRFMKWKSDLCLTS